jgi:hypothetical protein
MKQPELEPVFVRLRNILQKYSDKLTVSEDRPDYYCLNVDYSPKLGKGYPVAWIKTGKRYVSYHFMPVYMFPRLRENLSEKLGARMQGKSCFNFTHIDETLFDELEKLTDKGMDFSRNGGYGPVSS